MQDLIAHIYQAANGAQPWGDVLTRITDDLMLLGSQMVGQPTKWRARTRPMCCCGKPLLT